MNVTSIQNMFQGNPYSTQVGSLVERATDPNAGSEDWGLLMDIVDNINRTDCGPRDAIRALKKRMVSSFGKNNRAVLLVLTCVETCVKNCGYRFHVQVASREFIHELVKIIDARSSQMLQDRILGLLQSWADAFRGEAELREVERTVIELRHKGYEFPMTDLDHMAPIHTPRRTVQDAPILPKQSNLQQHQPPPAPMSQQPPTQPHQLLQHQQQVHHPQQHAHPPHNHHQHPQPPPPLPQQQQHAARMAQQPGMPQHQAELSGPITPTPEQVAKLNHDLQVVTGNIRVFNEMLNELSPSGISHEDLSLMQELHRTCRAMQQRIMELLEQLAHEELTSELLRINDDLNNVFVRYGRFERYRSQQTGTAEGTATAGAAVPSSIPPKPVAQQQHNNASPPAPPPPSYNQAMSNESSLIDLGGNSNDLSKRLADVHVANDSTGNQLNRLQATTASNAQVDEFDAFAQSRTMAHTTETRRGPTTGDPAPYAGEAPAASSLTAAVQQRSEDKSRKIKPFIPGIPDTKEDLDEMERWMETHDGASVPMSSSEFDQFLAEHGAGSSQEQPAPPPPPSRRQMKDDDKEGALFAL